MATMKPIFWGWQLTTVPIYQDTEKKSWLNVLWASRPWLLGASTKKQLIRKRMLCFSEFSLSTPPSFFISFIFALLFLSIESLEWLPTITTLPALSPRLVSEMFVSWKGLLPMAEIVFCLVTLTRAFLSGNLFQQRTENQAKCLEEDMQEQVVSVADSEKPAIEPYQLIKRESHLSIRN